MCSLITLPLGERGARVASAPLRTLTEARALLDRPLDLDRDPPLHRQRDLSLSLSLCRITICDIVIRVCFVPVCCEVPYYVICALYTAVCGNMRLYVVYGFVCVCAVSLRAPPGGRPTHPDSA